MPEDGSGSGKEEEETFWGDGYVRYLDYSDGFPVVYITESFLFFLLQLHSSFSVLQLMSCIVISSVSQLKARLWVL